MDDYEEHDKRFDAMIAHKRAFEYDKWMDEIPYMKFKPEWEVKAVPPFGGAVIRYFIKYNDERISVYLDCYNQLGYMDNPYWEAYPINGDTFRCYMNETDKLIKAIDKEFSRKANND